MQEKISGIELAIFSGKLNTICEEMGFVLQRSALSPNIKDRLDFSCALFDSEGRILAQAAHIPVHLGSMAYAMKDLVAMFDWSEGDMVVVNDPFKGGTHLPDVTMIAPLFLSDVLHGFVVNRAHHANIGSEAPGSMPLSDSLLEEGIVLGPQKIIDKGIIVDELARRIRSIEPNCDSELPEDFLAQISANQTGLMRMTDWLNGIQHGGVYFNARCAALNEYGLTLMQGFISKLPIESVEFSDVLDSDGFGAEKIPIHLELRSTGERLVFDFSGTGQSVKGNLNCPESVTASSVYYVIACLLPEYAPKCDGVFRFIDIICPYGSMLNAPKGSAVAAGNVETSMRVVDVVQGCLLKLGLDMPAAAQGSMNNIAMGNKSSSAESWDYYETLAGGMGANSGSSGLDAVQCHMTNTLNTPVESLELHYPIQITEYSIRRRSGGKGEYDGGCGLSRSYRFTAPASVTLLTERRMNQPWGVSAGAGKCGVNTLNDQVLPAKARIQVEQNDVINIKTPGGGAWSSGA
ncbi:5-oxoprolinase [Oleiphilus sp. HI0009]|nr:MULTISPECIES: hydantoinase B/oxoprolinase family protein [unclassified Oleiphilus]KZX78013.1 5-oxoprolinase [Oleiphilus sp. HI0009]KZY64570.1 5-oxoprolinase [Oleiphilus sp. HI0066]KZY68628.1 5-oxoprolinase [Oleiphilus sp. HI0067]KZZ57557.1 5-oxoprolinase [Oleiphilus sp. HI0125]